MDLTPTLKTHLKKDLKEPLYLDQFQNYIAATSPKKLTPQIQLGHGMALFEYENNVKDYQQLPHFIPETDSE